MKRRLGRSGIFVEVNGKYYLSEELTAEFAGQDAHIREQVSYYSRIGLLEMYGYNGSLRTTKFFDIYLKKLKDNIKDSHKNHPEFASPYGRARAF
jgi:hypothetical protein